jgi:hypothetical protein
MMNFAKREKHDKIIIVEGYMDAISLYQRGITNSSFKIPFLGMYTKVQPYLFALWK